MSRTTYVMLLGVALLASTVGGFSQSSKAGATSFSIVFKDGHQQTYSDVSHIDFKAAGTMVLTRGGHEDRLSLNEVARIDFSPANSGFQPGRNHFVGKWKVGQGNGDDFFITLNRDGQAEKTIGANHGTWEVVNGEARISWDDGWHDVIRPVGTKHEKVAYEPGKSFDAEPNNITDARRVNPQPI
jgi:hypothetical protein